MSNVFNFRTLPKPRGRRYTNRSVMFESLEVRRVFAVSPIDPQDPEDPAVAIAQVSTASGGGNQTGGNQTVPQINSQLDPEVRELLEEFLRTQGRTTPAPTGCSVDCISTTPVQPFHEPVPLNLGTLIELIESVTPSSGDTAVGVEVDLTGIIGVEMQTGIVIDWDDWPGSGIFGTLAASAGLNAGGAVSIQHHVGDMEGTSIGGDANVGLISVIAGVDKVEGGDPSPYGGLSVGVGTGGSMNIGQTSTLTVQQLIQLTLRLVRSLPPLITAPN